jgi:L-2,4-diaminobutyrate decarboxylase
MSAFDDLAAARARIRDAYSPTLLEDAGHRLADALATHLTRVQQGRMPVLPWTEPEQAVRDAGETLRSPAVQEGLQSDAFSSLVDLMLERGLNLARSSYIGHQVPAPVPLAGLFDAVGSVTNQVMAIYEDGAVGHRSGAGHGARHSAPTSAGRREPSPAW